MPHSAPGGRIIDTTDFYKAVGALIREARDKARITQDTLAQRVRLTRTSVTNIEKGRQKILLHTFCELAEALGLSPAALLPHATGSVKEPPLDDLLKGRPRKEREWIKSAFVSAQKDS